MTTKDREVLLQKKAGVVASIKEQVDSASATIFFDYRGLTVEELTALREKMRGASAQVQVCRNSLLKRAFDELDLAVSDKIIKGPIAIVSAKSDSVVAAKALVEFIKANEKAQIKGGMVDNELVDEKVIQELAKLPTKDILLGRLVGSMSAPINRFALSLSSPARGLVYALNAIIKEKSGGK